MTRKSFYFLIMLIVSAMVVACSSKTDTFKQEAEDFCKVHDPDNWRDYKNTGSYFDFQDELVKRIQKVVVTEEFRNIFKKLSEDDSRPDAYMFYKTEIQKLTGEEWDCPHAKPFYTVEWKTEPSNPEKTSTSDSDKNANLLVIRLEKNGDYIINSEKVTPQNSDKIEPLLQKLTSKMSKVKLITADGVSKEQLLEAMEKLSGVGVVNLTIETQGTNPPKLD